MSREQGLGHAEIAEKLGIEKSTVKNHMVRALNTLRRYLANPFSWIAGFGLLHILIKIISKNNF
jgi:hypothetical protein